MSSSVSLFCLFNVFFVFPSFSPSFVLRILFSLTSVHFILFSSSFLLRYLFNVFRFSIRFSFLFTTRVLLLHNSFLLSFCSFIDQFLCDSFNNVYSGFLSRLLFFYYGSPKIVSNRSVVYNSVDWNLSFTH